MKEYTVKRFADYASVDWNDVPKADIDYYGWSDVHYDAGAYAQVVLVDGIGFVAHLGAEEDKPMALRRGFYDTVWCDSCLEFFCAYDNTRPDFINVEMNSVGASTASLGKDRYERTKLTDLIERPFPIRSVVREGKWSATAFITFDNLETIYGISRDVFTSGYRMRANFYKCGDETAVPHFGMWNPVTTVEEDFHQPDYFGTLVIE